MPLLIFSLCDVSGNAVRPWAGHGYECWCIGTRHPGGTCGLKNNARHVGADVTMLMPPLGTPVAFIFARSSFTDLAVSGGRWMPSKGLEALANVLAVESACKCICEASEAPYLVELELTGLRHPGGVLRHPHAFSTASAPITDPQAKRHA
jgi:hypothetical protein